MLSPMMLDPVVHDMLHVRPLPWVLIEERGVESWWQTSSGVVVFLQAYFQAAVPHLNISVLPPNAPTRLHTIAFAQIPAPHPNIHVLSMIENSCSQELQTRANAAIARLKTLLLLADPSIDRWQFQNDRMVSFDAPKKTVFLDVHLLMEVQHLQRHCALYRPAEGDLLPGFETLEFWLIELPESHHARMALLS